MFVGVVTRGPDGKSLNSRFDNRSTEGYQNSLGNAIGTPFLRTVHHPCVYVFAYICTCPVCTYVRMYMCTCVSMYIHGVCMCLSANVHVLA